MVSTKSFVEQELLKVADEVWIATALLHRENPEREDFLVEEVVERAKKERLTGTLWKGVYVHVVQHCVANRLPNSGRYRMLDETAPGRRRLFPSGDIYHPEREGAKQLRAEKKFPPNMRGCSIGIAVGMKLR